MKELTFEDLCHYLAEQTGGDWYYAVLPLAEQLWKEKGEITNE